MTTVIASLESISITSDKEITIYFKGKVNESGWQITSGTRSVISLNFVKDNKQKIKLVEGIIGFAEYNYDFLHDKTSNQIKPLDEKILLINITEDISDFDIFNKIINKKSEIHIILEDDYDCNKVVLQKVEMIYQTEQVLHDTDEISKNFLYPTSYMNSEESLKTAHEKYFPIRSYIVRTPFENE